MAQNLLSGYRLIENIKTGETEYNTMETITPCILIVDDEETIRRSLVAYLEDEGFKIIATESGEEGLKILSKETIDVVIVDIRLAGIDGTAFIEQAHQMLPHIVFLICTGSVEFKLPEGLKNIGIKNEHIFRKPVTDLSALTEAIKNSLEE